MSTKTQKPLPKWFNGMLYTEANMGGPAGIASTENVLDAHHAS